MNALERAYLANSARMLFMQSAVDRVVNALSARDISSVLLKGAALIETVYPDPGQREMLDLDVLVRGWADRRRDAERSPNSATATSHPSPLDGCRRPSG